VSTIRLDYIRFLRLHPSIIRDLQNFVATASAKLMRVGGVPVTRNLTGMIGEIYEAVDDPGRWSEVIGKIARILRSEAGGLSLERLPSGSSVINVSYGFEPSLTAEYNAYYHSVNLPLHRARPLFSPGAVVASHDVCSDTTLANSEYYNECLKKWGFFYIMGGVVAMDSRSAGLIQFLRARRHGPFRADEKEFLAALNPHLNRALRMHDNTTTLGAILKTLDQIATAVLLLNKDRRVVYLNRPASIVLNRRDGLLLENGFLTAVLPAMQPLFQRLITASLTDCREAGASIEPGSLKIERSSSLVHPYSVIVSPMRTSSRALVDVQSALAVFILDPGQSPGSLQRTLRHLHGFTGMEVNLAIKLINGDDLSQACEALGITRNTGRAHLRSIFAKANVKRQAELVSVLIRSSVF
jgi:DNA-binding CsgD family transcriptional regulator